MVLYNSADAEPLNQWLVKNLDAISDAEPIALAKYILELLNMWSGDPEKEVRPRLVDELTDFLQREAAPFVDRLLAVLRSKSYLPYDDQSKPPTPPYLKRNADNKGKKRRLDDEDDEMSKDLERESRGPPKGPRRDNESRRSDKRPPEGPRADYARDRKDDRHGRSRSQGRSDHEGRPGDRKTGSKAKCRDYWENGFCNRGSSCPYSHGEDHWETDPSANNMPWFPPNDPNAPAPPNINPGQPNQGGDFMQGMGNIPGMGGINPMMAMQILSGMFPPGFIPPMGYMPNMGPMGYDPTLPQHPGGQAYDSGIQDLTPHTFRGGRGGGRGRGRGFPSNGPGNHTHTPSMSDDTAMQDGSQGPPNEEGMNGHFGGNESRGRGRGEFRGRGGRPERPQANRSSGDPNALTIVVEKLPVEKTSIHSLSDYFSKFGTVTNVAVDSASLRSNNGGRALVSFKEHSEALAAWKSEEAVFGNRFVRVFWHRPQPGGGAAGKKALEASAATLQQIIARTNGEDTEMGDGAQTLTNGHHASASEDVKMDVVTPKKPKTPQEIYEYASKVWMEKMKGIMDIMQSSTASEKDKEEAKAKFKVLKSQKPQPPGATPVTTTKPATSADGKEKLDLDLDALASGKQGEMTQEEAQAALARLQELAAERGLDPDEMEEDQPAYGYGRGRGYAPRRTWRGGYYSNRGRGRGRGAALAAMQSASLDLRTKKIVLNGFDGVEDAVALDLVQSFYLPTGLAEEVEKASSEEGIVVSFETRQQAEQALRGGPPTIEGLPSLTVQWYNPPLPPSALPKTDPVPKPATSNLDEEAVMERGPAKRPVRGDDHDEEDRW